MFIRELQVDGYGALQGLKLEFETPVTVLYGPNEAGKSTVLRFVRSMLYGFPTRKEPVERGEPVFGGRHGGRLLLSDKSGREWQLERYVERGSGLAVRQEGGVERSMAQAEWERLVLGGISERLFRQLFAVSLNELHELRSLQGEEIGNYLYHAGLAGGSALTAARRRIGSEMDRLFRPKGTTQEMNRLLAAVKETETAIRQSRDSVQYYNETRESLHQVENQIAAVDQLLPELRMQTAKLQGAYELREWWLKRESLLAEIAELRKQLPDPSVLPLLEDTAILWSELRSKRQGTLDKLEKAESSSDELRLLREKLAWDSEWVNALPEWERLESLREGMIAKREERAELEAERRMLEESVQGILPRLSADWGEAELLAFGGLAADREQVRRFQQSWEEEERASMALQAELRRLARQQEVLQAEAGSLTSRQALSIGLFVPRTRPALLQAWHMAEDARRSYERARAGIVPLSRSLGSRASTRLPKLTYSIAALLGVSAIAWPLLASNEGSVSTITYSISSLMLLLAVGLVIVSSRRHTGRSAANSAGASSRGSDDNATNLRLHRRQVNERLRQLLNDPETASAKLTPELSEAAPTEFLLQTETEDAVWEQLREAVHEQLERLEEIERGNSKQQEMQSRMAELRLERELVERDSMNQNDRLDELRSEWQQWLRTRKLPLHLTPESLPELLGMAEQGQAVLRQRQRVIERSNTLNNSINEFEQAATRLFESCPPPSNIRMDVLQAVQWLYRESARQFALKEEAGRIDRQLAAAEGTVVEIHGELTSIDNRIKALFSNVQVASEAEMEQRLRIDGRCLTLDKEAREIRIRLESGRDLDAQAQLYELLRSRDEASLALLLSEQKALLAAEEQLRSELLDRRGRLTQELERQRGEAELEDKGQRLRELQSKLEHLSERYAILAISDRLIVKTKAVFEEERQPEVLQRVSGYLRQMTNGSYIRIVAPRDTPTLLAETQDRRLLDSAFLSRGTQEQLYLAMRFALCDAASSEQPLPLLLDDLFVHFDERRLDYTVPVLEDLAQTRQVLLFTCHRHVAQTVASGIPSARVLTLGG